MLHFSVGAAVIINDPDYCHRRYRSVVCPSVRLYVRLSHSRTVLKPLGGIWLRQMKFNCQLCVQIGLHSYYY